MIQRQYIRPRAGGQERSGSRPSGSLQNAPGPGGRPRMGLGRRSPTIARLQRPAWTDTRSAAAGGTSEGLTRRLSYRGAVHEPHGTDDLPRHHRHRRCRDDGRRDRPGRARGRLRGRLPRRRRGGDRARRASGSATGLTRRAATARPRCGCGRRLGRRPPRPAPRRAPTLDGLADDGRPRHRGRARGPRAEADDLPRARRGAPRPRRSSPRTRARSRSAAIAEATRPAGSRHRPPLLQPGPGHAARRGRRAAARPTRRSSTRAAAIVDAWGKTPVRCADTPGLHRQPRQPAVHPRGAARSSRPARRASTAIDEAMRAAGFPMGPFELMDLVGIDVNLAAATGICEGLVAGDPRPSGSGRRRSRSASSRPASSAARPAQGFYRYDGRRAGLGEVRAAGRRAARTSRLDPATAIARPDHRWRSSNEAYRARRRGRRDRRRHRPRAAARRRPPAWARSSARRTGRPDGDRGSSTALDRRRAAFEPALPLPSGRLPYNRRMTRDSTARSARPGSSRPSGRPIGRYGGALASVRPDDLAAAVLRAVVDRAGIDPALVEDVILGCANQAGEDNRNVARMALLLAGLPGRGRRADRQPAVRLGAPGDQLGGPRDRGRRRRRVHRRRRRIDDPRAVRPAQGRVGRTTAARASWPTRPSAGGSSTRAWPSATTRTRWARPPRTSPSGGASSRERQDAFALESQQRAVAAIEAGRFADQIVPIAVPQRKGEPLVVDRDEHPRADTTARGARPGSGRRSSPRAARSRPATAPGINDGASAVLLVEAGPGPRARPAPAGARRRDGRRRRRPGGHGHRARPGDAQGARAGRDRRRRPRPHRAQRGVRVAVARLHRRARARSRPRSTSTAARSRSAIRSG